MKTNKINSDNEKSQNQNRKSEKQKVFSKKIKLWLKKEIVFEISFVLALISSLLLIFLKKKVEIINAIDFRVLSILLSLMLVVSGFQKIGIFSWAARTLCSKLKNLRLISLALILLCFFSSMLITNDVTLITFVPFSLLILSQTKNSDKAIIITVLETIAANLGSMLTPIGNPQNLFLFSKMNISLFEFTKILLPYTLVSLVLLLLSTFFIPKRFIFNSHSQPKITENLSKKEKNHFFFGVFLFSTLFILCILCVLNILPYTIVLPIVILFTAIFSWKLIFSADFMLLLTFCSFFIFTHNITKIDSINDFLKNAVSGNEFFSSLVVSQIISNVPATLLLFPFSTNQKELLLGADLGGLGTIIASLASLISFKFYSNFKEKTSNFNFLAVFSLFNFIYLAILVLLYFVLRVC